MARQTGSQRVRPFKARKSEQKNPRPDNVIQFRRSVADEVHALLEAGKTQRETAARLYRLSADQGDATAQVNLGIFYANGRGGLSKDEREAARLYRLAADQGNAYAQAALSQFESP
jgi:TPR repeat protein